MTDNVNHPAHYEKSTSLECIDTMEIAFGYDMVLGFCMCNAFKYLWRYKNKNGKEDLDKAKWYLDRAYGYSKDPDITAKIDTIANLVEAAEQEME